MNKNDIPNIEEVREKRNENEVRIEALKSEIECRERSNMGSGIHRYQNCDREHKVLSEMVILSLLHGVEIKQIIASPGHQPHHMLNLVDEEAIALRDFLNLLYPEKEFKIIYNGI